MAPTEEGATFSPTAAPTAALEEATPPADISLATIESVQQQSNTNEGGSPSTDRIVNIVLAVLFAGSCVGMAAIWRRRSNHVPAAPDLERQPPAVSNPTFATDPPDDSYEAAQTFNPQYQPTLPERMYNRDYAEIDTIQPPREPTYNEVQMYDQTPQQTAQYVALEGDHQTYDAGTFA